MPILNKIIIYIYLSLTLYAFIIPNNVPIDFFLPGLISMWFSLIVYLLFYLFKRRRTTKIEIRPLNGFHINCLDNTTNFFYLSLLMMIIMPFYIRFYTGNSIGTIFYNLITATSNYQEYQAHFKDSNLSQFTLQKVPYIIFMIVFKFLSLYITIYLLLTQFKLKLKHKLSFLFIFLSYILSSLGRGTFFEVFEFFLMFGFASIYRRKILFNKSINIKAIVRYLPIILGLLVLYIVNKNLRSSYNDDLESSVILLSCDRDSFLYFLSPALCSFLLAPSGYFYFGHYFTSMAFQYYWFDSFENILSLLLVNFDSVKPVELVKNTTYCGAMWVPDMAIYFQDLGIVLFMFLLSIIASLAVLTDKRINYAFISRYELVINVAIQYFILLFFFSLPIGNFITASTANVISLLLYISLFVCLRFRLKK